MNTKAKKADYAETASVRFPRATLAAVDRLAKSQDRSRNYTIVSLVESALARASGKR